MLKLTSYERMRRYLAGEGNDILTDKESNRRDILIWINSISNKVQKYLNRDLFIQEHTEYFDLKYGGTEFWVNSPTISSISSVKYDSTGLFDGGESTLDDSGYHIGTNNNTVVLVSSIPYTSNRGIQIVYTGGLALSGVQSIYSTTQSDTWTVDNFCIGNDSGAVGIVNAQTATTLTIEVLYGVFDIGETLTEYTGEDGTTATGETATLDSKTQTALAESYPDIVDGCEMEIRYYKKHKLDFENTGTTKEGTTIRRDSKKSRRLPLQPEVIDIIDGYRRIAFA